MNRSSPDYHLIARALANVATAKERARLHAWIAADPEHLRLWTLLREAWALSGRPDAASRYDAEADWPQVLARLHAERPAPAPAAAPASAPTPARRASAAESRGWRGVALRAAVLAGLLLGPWLGWMLSRPSAPGRAPAVAEVSAPRGETKEVVLPDGSRVRLGAESTLRYAAELAGARREVGLTGLAQVEVAPDAARPFLVRTPQGVTTRVVGTRCVVRAYPEARAVEVAVAEGRVALRPARAAAAEVALGGGQVGRLAADGRASVTNAESLDAYFAWTRGVLVLKDGPLAEALAELGRWYDAELKVEDPRLAARLIATTAGDVPLADVLAGIVLALDARYEQRGDTVVLVP